MKNSISVTDVDVLIKERIMTMIIAMDAERSIIAAMAVKTAVMADIIITIIIITMLPRATLQILKKSSMTAARTV